MLREYEDYYFREQPSLPNELIVRLFLGDSYRQRGILHFIGSVESQPVIAKGCLSLLNKLLNFS
jgi:hypothetical protein